MRVGGDDLVEQLGDRRGSKATAPGTFIAPIAREARCPSASSAQMLVGRA